jgi:hypothetical protein
MTPLPSERSNWLMAGVIAGVTILVAIAVFGTRLAGLW